MLLLSHVPEELNSLCGRVKLIAFTQEHHHDLAVLLSDPRVWEQGFAPGMVEPPGTPELMEQFIAARALVPVLFTVLVNGEIAGTTGVVKVYEKRKTALIGRTVFGTPYWGIGLNTIAKDVLLGWIFEQGVRTVECEVSPTNFRSLTSLSRMGFAEVGTRRRNTPGGRKTWRNLVVMRNDSSSWQPSELHLR